MFIVKRLKRAIALLMIMLTVGSTAGAEFYDVPSELQTYGQQIHSGALSYFGRRSFSGYCGTYVRCQLRAMGIFEGGYDLHGNGNEWYSNFENLDKTSGNYYVYREKGEDCLYKLQEKYGTNLRNIVLSFPVQAGYSPAYPGAGHAFILYEIRDGIAYYSESFGFGKFREGQVVAEDIDSMLKRYSRRHGAITGCVMLSSENLNLDAEQMLADATLAELKEDLEALSDIAFLDFTELMISRVVA